MIAAIWDRGSAATTKRRRSPGERWDWLISRGIVMLLFAMGVGIWYAEKNQARIERADRMTTEEYRTALEEEQRDKMKKRSTSWPVAMAIMAQVWCVFYLPYELLCWLISRGVRRVRGYLEEGLWNR